MTYYNTSNFSIPLFNGGIMDISEYKTITSCGLVVFYGNSVLMIKRDNKWDLPKGKPEQNEQHVTTALRECEEETGLRQSYLQITRSLYPSQHFTKVNGETYIKTTHWFMGKYKGPPQHVFLPQSEEGITECQWVSLKELDQYMPETREYARYILGLTLALLKDTQDKMRRGFEKNSYH